MRPFDPALLRRLPSAKRGVLVLAAIGVGSGIVAVATCFALAAVVVAVVRSTPLAGPGGALVGLLVLRGALAAATERFAASAGAHVSAGLRERFLADLVLRPADLRPDPASAATLAAQGATAVEAYIARYLPALVSAAVLPVFIVVTMAVVDWPSALIVILTVPLLPLFAALIGAATGTASRRRWQSLTQLSGHFLDVVKGLPTLVGYGRAERQVSVVAEVSQRHRRATMGTLRLAFLSSVALELLSTICVAIVAVIVGVRLAGGELDLLVGLVAILLAPEAYWPIRRVGGEFHSAADGAAALQQLLDSAAEPVAGHREVADEARRRVVVDGLRYAHPGRACPVFDHLSLSAGVGLMVVTGPSGAGKSTLLELIAGLRVSPVGTITTPPVHLVTQRPFLLEGSVRDNLSLGAAAATSADLWAALHAVGLDEVVAALPEGLDDRLGDDGAGLSAGQRARLVLARAMVSDRQVLLLDEPTAHLDQDTAAEIHQVIAGLARRRCVIAVTHHAGLLALADSQVEVAARPPVPVPS